MKSITFIDFAEKQPTTQELARHLQTLDSDFLARLTSKVDFDVYVNKLNQFALFSLIYRGNDLVGVLAAYNNGNEIYISNFSLSEKYRDMGNGKKMFQSLLHWAQGNNIQQISLEVHNQNTNALGFYNHLGFQIYSSIEDDLLLKKILIS